MFVKRKSCKILANIYFTSTINRAIKMQNLINKTSSNAINIQIATNIWIVVNTQAIVNI